MLNIWRENIDFSWFIKINNNNNNNSFYLNLYEKINSVSLRKVSIPAKRLGTNALELKVASSSPLCRDRKISEPKQKQRRLASGELSSKQTLLFPFTIFLFQMIHFGSNESFCILSIALKQTWSTKIIRKQGNHTIIDILVLFWYFLRSGTWDDAKSESYWK